MTQGPAIDHALSDAIVADQHIRERRDWASHPDHPVWTIVAECANLDVPLDAVGPIWPNHEERAFEPVSAEIRRRYPQLDEAAVRVLFGHWVRGSRP